MPRPRACRRKTRGQALVEFAFVLPVMLVLTLGMIDFGRAFVFGVAVQNGAREAARVAANAGRDPSITTSVILQRLIDASSPALSGCSAGTSDLTGTGCPWHATVSSIALGGSATVTVRSTQDISFFAGRVTGAMGLYFSAFAIQGSATMAVL